MRGPIVPGHQPIMKPQKAKDIKGTTKRLLKYLGKHKIKLVIICVLVIISTLMTTIATRIMGIAIDELIGKGNISELIKICLVLVVLYVLASVFTWLQSVTMINIAQQTVVEIRKEVFDKLQRLPLKYFDTNAHGDVMSRVTNDVDNISSTLNQSISQVFSSVLTVLFTAVAMLLLSPVLTLISILIIPVMIGLTKFITEKSRKHFSMRQKKLGKLNGYIEEVISGQKVVKVFNREKKEIEGFKVINRDLLSSGIKAEIYSGIIGPLSMSLNSISYALIAGAGGLMMVLGLPMSLGTISAFLSYSKQFTRPLNEIANLYSAIMSALAGAERVFDVLDEKEELADVSNAYNLKKVEGTVIFEHVDFSYEEGNPILKDINLYAKPGQTIALVGPTGAGKTTIINLLTRFYDIQDGSITIDGHNIKDIQRDSLRAALGIVLQDTYLFTGTIEENIRYGKLDATFEEIKEASKLANAHEFVKRLPEGYNTVLTDGGGNLSQGQRQMLSIARAILSDPSILILDEATSSVDTRTEMKIQEAMHNLMKGRTNFVIAHRLSTIKDADLIAVINDGNIVERGNHQQLLEKKGFYYKLYMSQFA
ncbi:MAG TPA: multidrug ABC transporter ATP-binding protein [Lachnospiraceae bacterium]|nr:multidrug ABC transporter ATP-binding protein [Lachnospiraceae bacterium]